MSAKLLHSLTDEHPDLQKQIGCMSGILHLFDRNHILAGKRINGQSHKRLPPGESLTGASFSSSSCSSSFSSFDCNKTAQPESSSFDRTIFPETPSRDWTPVNQPNASPRLGRQSLDLRDVVKESIYREERGLSVKTTVKEEAAGHAMKHRDSPRPLQPKYEDGLGINGKPRVPADINESLGVFAKFREAPRNFREAREPPRSSYKAKDGSFLSVPKDAPRFSYDGREMHRPSFESQDTFKSTTKLKELPRLSLDSRDGSTRGCNSSPKSNSLFKDLQKVSNSSKTIPNLQQELGTPKRPPSVVAKLMGLEALPDSISATESQMGLIKTCHGEDCDTFSRLSKRTDESKQNRISGSPWNSHRDPISPQLKNPDPVMKPISSSRFPIEPAPWRHPYGGQGFQKLAFRNPEAPARALSSSPSVYGEIEKRWKKLEFKQSDKDLRALKQMLEAMQVKGLLETKKEDQASYSASQSNYNGRNHTSRDQNPILANRRTTQNNRTISPAIKGASPPRTYESPIVIIKPAKFIEKSGIPASSVIPIDGLAGLRKLRSGDSVDCRKGVVNNQTAKDLTPKRGVRDPAKQALSSMDKKTTGRTLRSTQTSTRPQLLSRENTTSSGRSSCSVSPRLQQKKLELEKRSRPPIVLSDSSKPRRQSSRQPTDSGSPGRKFRPNSLNLQPCNDLLSEISCEKRNLSHQDDEISLQSDSQIDTEVTSADQSAADINRVFIQQGSQSPSRKVANCVASGLKKKKPTPRLSEHESLEEIVTVTSEQPSPVSVLDASFYRDDLPCPMKMILNAFEDDETQISDDIPRQPYSDHDEATTDYIASLCKNANPDHRYISEILLASGILLRDLSSDLTSVQLHPSGHPINPDLFFVLEQINASTGLSKDEQSCEMVAQSKPNQERPHRKLIFDAVNEILVRKLALVHPLPELWSQHDKLAGRTLMSAQRLMRELCPEIDQLQADNPHCTLDNDDDWLKSILWEDVMRPSENWRDFCGEVSGIVLDVERLVFKDLVDEIVSGEAASLRAKRSRHCRQLFAK
ncbi:hypothetical protein HHK36_015477 [Tetracentron sinense]|uniref:DUF4378 domain-containing protein n=1 Tax=Tetracentron sinense TaxID=13715 RepID=A0A834Z788_TETSI|nr:hypothetical protein HHK36_015477 [Tetracentron sinense]